MELLRFTLNFSHRVLDLGENLQCNESWGNVPLEFQRLPVNSIQLSTLRRIHKPINLLLPCAYGRISNSSYAQHRVGEYEGLRCGQLNCSVMQQSRPSPRFSLPVDQGFSWNFCLFADQLPGYIEHLFHCSL